MITSFPFTIHRSPFTVLYPLSVFRAQWLMPALRNLGEGGVNSKCIACPALNPERSSLQSDYGASRFSAGVDGKWLTVNGTTERSF